MAGVPHHDAQGLGIGSEAPSCPLQYLDICLAPENELGRL
jgi:hypothetical protein